MLIKLKRCSGQENCSSECLYYYKQEQGNRTCIGDYEGRIIEVSNKYLPTQGIYKKQIPMVINNIKIEVLGGNYEIVKEDSFVTFLKTYVLGDKK